MSINSTIEFLEVTEVMKGGGQYRKAAKIIQEQEKYIKQLESELTKKNKQVSIEWLNKWREVLESGNTKLYRKYKQEDTGFVYGALTEIYSEKIQVVK